MNSDLAFVRCVFLKADPKPSSQLTQEGGSMIAHGESQNVWGGSLFEQKVFEGGTGGKREVGKIDDCETQ